MAEATSVKRPWEKRLPREEVDSKRARRIEGRGILNRELRPASSTPANKNFLSCRAILTSKKAVGASTLALLRLVGKRHKGEYNTDFGESNGRACCPHFINSL